MEALKHSIQMIYEKNREQTFKSWKFNDNSNCSAKKLSEAGFYFIGTTNEPDAVQCFMCDKELDGWDNDDNPWEEHKIHSKECSFANLGKPESALTMNQLANFRLEVVAKYTDNFLKMFNNKEVIANKDTLINLKKRLNTIKKSKKTTISTLKGKDWQTEQDYVHQL